METYDRALAKFDTNAPIPTLSEIRKKHMEAVGILEQNVRSMGGQPSTESGAWGTFANAVQAAANLFGDGSALASLEQGEEHGKRSMSKLWKMTMSCPSARR